MTFNFISRLGIIPVMPLQVARVDTSDWTIAEINEFIRMLHDDEGLEPPEDWPYTE